MIRELIEKRAADYLQTTKDILGRYEETLIHAIRLYSKTGKDIQITSVYLYPTNPNFIVNAVKVEVNIGDRVKDVTGEIIEVTAENINTVPTNNMKVVVSAKLLEEGHAVKIYDQIKYIDDFIHDHGSEKFARLMASGISDFGDVLNEENLELLEELTDPIDTILNSLDELQNVQYNLFNKNNDRTLH